MSQNRRFVLLGSGEFEPWSEAVERAAVGEVDPVALVVPTASAPEGDQVFDRWARMGLEHYAAMGWPARVLPLRTHEEAEREDIAASLDEAGIVFFSGGNPKHLARTIAGTRFWYALVAAMDRGMVFAGCSAGAMVASQTTRQARDQGVKTSWVSGLGLVPNVSFGVHWDRARRFPGMRLFVTSRVPRGSWFVGIDERTAIVGDGAEWTVHGLGSVQVVHEGSTTVLGAGATFATEPSAR